MSKPEIIVHEDGKAEIVDDGRFFFTPEESAEQKKISTKCGHVARRLARNEALTGKVLEFALSVVGEDSDIGIKLKNGEQLTDYELHLMLDVHLLHKRLARPAVAKPGA
jgi:hypothetical protein